MHLLNAQPGQVDDAEPVDLGQTPGDVVFISAADTELAALSQARSEMANPPELRLASLSHLQHPMSVDLHLDTCCTKSKLVIARVLGGAGYWKYGLEQCAIRLGQAGIPFAALPGDDKPDEDLWRLSTVPRPVWEVLTGYLVEGGPENAGNFLRLAGEVVQNLASEDQEKADLGDDIPAPKPLLKAGIYWPGAVTADIETARQSWTEGAPVVPLIFYRALVQGAGLNPINRLVKSLLRAGLNPLPIFVASLKDPLSAATIDSLFTAAPPAVILNCTAFAVGSPHTQDPAGDNPLTAPSANGAPVFQVVLSGGAEEQWHTSSNGLNARDIAMNVALPEVDGRILSRAVSFKGQAFFDEATQCPIAAYRAVGDRIDFVVQLALKWANLRKTPVTERRVALVLANYPNKDGRLANGVGLDTPQAKAEMERLNAEVSAGRLNPVRAAEELLGTLS